MLLRLGWFLFDAPFLGSEPIRRWDDVGGLGKKKYFLPCYLDTPLKN